MRHRVAKMVVADPVSLCQRDKLTPHVRSVDGGIQVHVAKRERVDRVPRRLGDFGFGDALQHEGLGAVHRRRGQDV